MTRSCRFYAEGKGFTPAGELGIGTSIVTRAGPAVQVASVERHNAPATVYTFVVEDTHTYFVGAANGGVEVHNTCYRNLFLAANPELDAGEMVHHTIPQAVLTKYPGAFTEEEIQALGNQKGINYAANPWLHPLITRYWAQFYGNDPTANRSEIEAFAQWIGDEFGGNFGGK